MAPAAVLVYNRPMTQPIRPVGPGDHVFLVDGSSFVFRAYFQSIRQDPKYNYRSDKLPVGAVRLFATKVLQFLRDGAAGIKPTHLAIIFDKSENSFRRELYPALQGAPTRPAARPRAAVPADARDGHRLRPDPDRAGPLRGRRPHRHLRDRRRSAKGADVLIISADKDLMQLVGPGVAMFDPASGDREERRIGPAEVVDYFGLPADKVVDIQALAGDFDRQRARRAGHRRQDGGAIDRRIRRPRHAARPRRRDQAAEAARDADRPRERQAHPPVETAGQAGHRRRGGRAARRARNAEAGSRAADRLPQGDGVHRHHQARRRLRRPRRECDRARPALRRPRRLARPQRRAGGAGSRDFSRRARRRSRIGADRPGIARRDGPDAHAADARRRARSGSARDAVRRRRLPDRQRRRDAAGVDRPRRRGGRRRLRHRDDLARSAAGGAGRRVARIGAGRGLLHSDRPQRRRGRPVRGRRPAAGPDRRSGSDRAAEAAAGRPRRAEDRPERQIRLARLRPPRRRGRALRRHHADLLRARFRGDQRRPRHGRLVRALARPQDDRVFRSRRLGTQFHRLRPRRDRQGDRIRRRGRRRDAAPVARAQAPPRRRAHDDRLRDARAADDPAAGADGSARRVDRPRHALAPVGRIRARDGADRSRSAEAGRGAVQPLLAQAARRHPVRPDGPAGRQEDRDRRLVDLRRRARRPRRTGPRAAGAHSRLAPARQAEIDLHRRAAELRRSAHQARPHLLRARFDHHRPAVVVRPQFAEHPGAQRGRAQDPPRLRRRGRAAS